MAHSTKDHAHKKLVRLGKTFSFNIISSTCVSTQEQFAAVSEEQLNKLDEKVIRLSQDLQKNQQACRDLDAGTLSSYTILPYSLSLQYDFNLQCHVSVNSTLVLFVTLPAFSTSHLLNFLVLVTLPQNK